MIRVLTALLGAAIGAAIAYLIAQYFGLNPTIPVLGGLIGSVVGYTMSYSTDVAFNGAQRKELAQGVDAINLVYWIAGPALKVLEGEREGFLESYEHEVRADFISELVLEHTVNEAEIIRLARMTAKTGTRPSATIRRHNRAYAPRFWRKSSMTHKILARSSYLLIEAGAGREAMIWYLYAAKELKIEPNEAAKFIFAAIDGQKEKQRHRVMAIHSAY